MAASLAQIARPMASGRRASGYHRHGAKQHVPDARPDADVRAEAERLGLLLLPSDNKTRWKGVYVHNERFFRAQIKVHQRQIVGQTRRTAIEAALDCAWILSHGAAKE